MGEKIEQVFDEVEDEKGFSGKVKLIQKTGIKSDEAMAVNDSEKYDEVKEAADDVLGEKMKV